jgi:hypothetical protein
MSLLLTLVGLLARGDPDPLVVSPVWTRTGGVATVEVAIPNNPDLIGMKFHAQWLIPDASPATTRVLEITVQRQDPFRGW